MCFLCAQSAVSPSAFATPQSVSSTPLANVYTALNSAASWSGGGLGIGAYVTYSFDGPWGQEATGVYAGAVTPLSASDAAAVRLTMQQFENVANLVLTETANGSDAQIAIRNEAIEGRVEGYAYLPDGTAQGGNVTIDSSLGAIAPNTMGWYVALHELGHAMGLLHPFDENGGQSTPKTNGIPVGELTNDYTVMAYNGDWTKVTGLQLYDIATLQLKYGANYKYHSGNDTYTFDATGAAQSYALWDGGGVDTFDASSHTANVTIDLRDGDYLNTIGVEEVRIAFNAQIENAVAGSGNDSVIGNEQANTLLGGRGADTIHAGMNDDVVVGGIGTSDNADSGDTLYGDLGSDTIYGNAGDDILIGGRAINDATEFGDDTLYGGLGDDRLYGNAGNDVLVGAGGNDSLYGGVGDDTFIITPNNQTDVIYGFQGAGQAGGDVIQLYSNMNGTGIDNFAELIAVAATDGTHSWLATGGGNGVLVLFVTPDQFIASDFAFV